MKNFTFATLTLAALLLAGCGGNTAPSTAIISGRVTDTAGQPVRGATVRTLEGVNTTTTSNGTYILRAVPAKDQNIYAEFIDGGTTYRGQNLSRNADGEQTPSVNIMIAPSGQLATMKGYVENTNGQRLRGARVFAYGAGAFSSTSAITDSQGFYQMRGLISGIDYQVNASGTGYSSDFDVFDFANGEEREVTFILGSPGNPVLPAIDDVIATAWTSAPITRSDSRMGEVAENIKRLWDPKRATKPSTRLSPQGNPVEVQLEWTPLIGNNFLGYNVYRGIDSSTPVGIDFYRDPLAGSYIDTDQNLLSNRTYSYQLTALGTKYPGDSNAEGPKANALSIATLGDLNLDTLQENPIRFRWQPGSGATEYVVFVFDKFPGIGVSSIWNNSSAPVGGLSLTYGGSALVPGRTYFYVVLGLANDQNSRTISSLGSFVYSN